MNYHLRLTQAQHGLLQSHLFPGDHKEAVALLLCGRRRGESRHIFTVREVHPVPYADCIIRKEDQVTWDTQHIDALVQRAFNKGLAIVKVHSHPTGNDQFSLVDDESDASIFASVASLLADGLPHASVIMGPDGSLFGRVIDDGEIGNSLASIMVVGDDIRYWSSVKPNDIEGFTQRTAQTFGQGTIELLKNFSIAVVGCSGTGSIVIEQLARLGVGRLVLVDSDVVEEKNLNRILNSGKADAVQGKAKVHVLASAIEYMGLGTQVLPLPYNLVNADVVRAVAECDFVFGCTDGVEARHLLNRLATFYNLPYFDVGVRLDADGHGGIDTISGAVHYLQPGGSSLLSRGVYSLEQVRAEELWRTDPEMYQRQLKEGYIHGVAEDRPAVISINMLYASLCVNEFLARIHPYRNNDNGEYAQVAASLTEVQFYMEAEQEACSLLEGCVGKGDVVPLLGRPALS
ncbi:hypothetical protein IAD21_06393 (plasmid) [Abditibacteriota bacterium]|nr:hypothetical protein IAD21_06393 [Abditibacteriota bacterium]